jgi:hypothetical protein
MADGRSRLYVDEVVAYLRTGWRASAAARYFRVRASR